MSRHCIGQVRNTIQTSIYNYEDTSSLFSVSGLVERHYGALAIDTQQRKQARGSKTERFSEGLMPALVPYFLGS